MLFNYLKVMKGAKRLPNVLRAYVGDILGLLKYLKIMKGLPKDVPKDYLGYQRVT